MRTFITSAPNFSQGHRADKVLDKNGEEKGNGT
jgi:hypothetical protein